MRVLSRLLFTLALCLCASAVHATVEHQPPLLPDDEAVHERLRAFVDHARGAPGVVVGLYDANGPRLYAYGKARAWRRAEIDPAARFEIGSISKGLNGLLLAEMIGRGEVRADQPIGELLPEDLELAPEVAAITLEDLAVHHSGLPRLPEGVGLRRSLEPYEGTTPDDVFDALVRQSPERVAERRGGFEYSNFGAALLGQLLARRAQRPWQDLLRDRVLEPLDIAGAGLLVGARPHDVVQGHRAGRAVRGWILDAYAPTGGVVLPAVSLLDLGERLLAGEPAFVAEALRARRSFGKEGSRQVGLGWFHGDIGGQRMIWHNGGTAGARSFLGVMPEHGWVVAVLANGEGDVDALAAALIDPGRPFARSSPGWSGLVLTVLGLLAVPAALVLGLRKVKAGTLDRMRLLERIVQGVFVLVLLLRHGSWTRVPFDLWWLAFGIAGIGAGLLLWRGRQLPWLLPGRRWIGSTLALVFACLVVALWLLPVLLLG